MREAFKIILTKLFNCETVVTFSSALGFSILLNSLNGCYVYAAFLSAIVTQEILLLNKLETSDVLHSESV